MDLSFYTNKTPAPAAIQARYAELARAEDAVRMIFSIAPANKAHIQPLRN